MSSDERDLREERRRARYRLDPAWRAKTLEAQARYEGRDTGYLTLQMKKGSYTSKEVCSLALISESTFDRYIRMGLIPKATYPSGNRVYWPHQVLLILRLFKRMRAEGWPKVPPHFVGSASWTRFCEQIESQWVKEKHNASAEEVAVG